MMAKKTSNVKHETTTAEQISKIVVQISSAPVVWSMKITSTEFTVLLMVFHMTYFWVMNSYSVSAKK